jgi:hypothetical protein
VPTFADIRCGVVRATDPTAVFLILYIEAATFSSNQLLSCTHEAEWTPFQIHYFSENLLAPGIKTVISGSVARNYDHQTTEAV